MQSSSIDQIVFRLSYVVDGRDRTFNLYAGLYRIGRTSASDIKFLVSGVSRQHAILRVTSKGLEIEDMGSCNGSFVDGRRVECEAVAPGAELRLGPVILHIEAVSQDRDIASHMVG